MWVGVCGWEDAFILYFFAGGGCQGNKRRAIFNLEGNLKVIKIS